MLPRRTSRCRDASTAVERWDQDVLISRQASRNAVLQRRSPISDAARDAPVHQRANAGRQLGQHGPCDRQVELDVAHEEGPRHQVREEVLAAVLEHQVEARGPAGKSDLSIWRIDE